MPSVEKILAFHQTSERFYPGINNVKPGYFFSIIELLESFGFHFQNPLNYLDKDIDENSSRLIVTFDDGYNDNFEIISWLCENNCPPVVFIPTDYIDKINSWEYSSSLFPAQHLNKNQIAEISRAGAIIGSHGKSHKALTAFSGEELRNELDASRKILEDITGQEVNLLSFPFGRTNSSVNDMSIETGYRFGFALQCYDIDEPKEGFVKYRMPIYGNDDYFSLKARLCENSRFERFKNKIINNLAGGTIITSRRLK